MELEMEQEARVKPETLSAAVQDHKLSGRTPCAFGFAMSKVPAKRWNTRADLYECLARARTKLNEEFREPLRLTELAAHAGVSPFHFQRLFKEFFGVSPNERQRFLRLQAARELIENGMSVTEACYEVGFLSPSSFTRFFKREFGVSPSSLSR
jgi:AraC-like DNA-binding protein